MLKLDQSMKKWLPARVNSADVNKSTYGHVAIVGGSVGLLGAPVLCSHAAMRAGAGLVTLMFPAELEALFVARLSPVVMTRALPSADGTISASASKPALELVRRLSAVGLGPGLGKSSGVTEFVHSFVAGCSVPLVLDADALNALATEITASAVLLKDRKNPTVLTPHPGELARLLSISTKEVQADRAAAIRRAVEIFDCVVVLKGHHTLIADPSGALYENSTGNPGMATAGAGDVLTGVIATLLAQNLKPLHAAAIGVYVHGLAGDLGVKAIGGTAGLIATDIIDQLPRAIGQLQGT